MKLSRLNGKRNVYFGKHCCIGWIDAKLTIAYFDSILPIQTKIFYFIPGSTGITQCVSGIARNVLYDEKYYINAMKVDRS